jgi:UDP-GlcNAc:undecaprenyl-phosphate GlcNAc-1-phosphate transferase
MAVLALVIAFAVADRATPWAAAVARRRGFVARANPDVPTHVAIVPLLGGVAIVAALAPAIAIARWWGLAGALAVLVALGAYKDRVDRAVSPAAQLAVQTVAACALWAGGFRVGLASPAADLVATIVVVLAIVNAWNYIDIVDGLAASVAAAAAALFVATGDRSAALIAAALCGGTLGYLRHNWAPARVFMGDVGSFAIGIAFSALALDAIAGGRRASLAALIVPLGDLAITTCVRASAGISPFRGGPEHVPLRLLARGWTAPQIALAASAVTLAAGATAWLVMR